jgi:hypothetical protein
VTPVMQTLFYDPKLPADDQRGNCLQAVVASLLDLDLDAVPHFVGDHIDSAGELNWWVSLCSFLARHGYRITEGAVTAMTAGVDYMAMGPSPRGNGLHHIVLYRDGAMIHDPHPDQTGLVEVASVWTLEPAL